MSKINLILRGHVRNSFQNEKLRDLLIELQKRQEVDIFMHTWNIYQNNISWRNIPKVEIEVNEYIMSNYFKGVSNIKKIIVEDDKKLELKGTLVGTICSTPCPVIGYKRMFYGMLKIAEHVYKNVDKKEKVVQTRFDLFTNSFPTNPKDFLSFCDRPIPKDYKIEFWDNVRPLIGIDNFYMATVENMYRFLRHLYFNLDELNKKHRNLRHQEHLSFFERHNFETEEPILTYLC